MAALVSAQKETASLACCGGEISLPGFLLLYWICDWQFAGRRNNKMNDNNPPFYITPGLSFRFDYFSLRKLRFPMPAVRFNRTNP